MHAGYTCSLYPLGDTAITIDFGNSIAEAVNDRVMAFYDALVREPIAGVVELVPAFCTLTVFYDVAKVGSRCTAGSSAFSWMKNALEKRLAVPPDTSSHAGRMVRIPVCYDGTLAVDMADLEKHTGLSAAAIIALHTGRTYRVFMLGFLPGFAYLGPLDPRITMPRKATPGNIAAGSVGIAGEQTGIYPLASPGGWQIIGRTPLRIFDAAREKPVLLQAGDQVRFYSITPGEFEQLESRSRSPMNQSTT